MADIYDRASELEQYQRDEAIKKALDRKPVGASSLVCHTCGEDIPEARRLAVVACTRCINCQKDYEHGRK